MASFAIDDATEVVPRARDFDRLVQRWFGMGTLDKPTPFAAGVAIMGVGHSIDALACTFSTSADRVRLNYNDRAA